MTNSQLIENFVNKLTAKIEFRMSTFEESYETAKAKVKEESTAGSAVWEILDSKFAA